MNIRIIELAVVALVLVFGAPTRAQDGEAKKEHNNGGWSETVGGLRAKAMVDQPEFTLGEDLHLFVMIQNVSDHPIDRPFLRIMPNAGLAENDHPFGKAHPYNAMVIGRPADRQMSIRWAMQTNTEYAREVRPPLAPGEILPVVIRLCTGGDMALQVILDDGVIRENIVFSAAIDPGEYELTFLLDTLGLGEPGEVFPDEVQAVRLQTPPVRVQAIREGARLEREPARAVSELIRKDLAVGNNGWSGTFRGLRIKPVVSNQTFDVGDALVLFVMMQNTTENPLTIPGPLLTPQTRAPEPQAVGGGERLVPPRGRGFNARLTVEPAEARARQIHGGLEPIAEPQSILLEPRGIHVLIVRMTTGRAEPVREQPAFPDATREGVHLDAVREPGIYELRFSYAPEGLDGEQALRDSPWAGYRFDCPVIRIEAENRVAQ